MIAVIQRVKCAEVYVSNVSIAKIGYGILALVGIHREDTNIDVDYLSERLPILRIFPDDKGKMNKSLMDIGGEILLVSQFTLLGDVYKGRRPGFTDAALPDKAIPLLENLKNKLLSQNISVQEGKFGAEMEVSLINDGPVTFIIDTKIRI